MIKPLTPVLSNLGVSPRESDPADDGILLRSFKSDFDFRSVPPDDSTNFSSKRAADRQRMKAPIAGKPREKHSFGPAGQGRFRNFQPSTRLAGRAIHGQNSGYSGTA